MWRHGRTVTPPAPPEAAEQFGAADINDRGQVALSYGVRRRDPYEYPGFETRYPRAALWHTRSGRLTSAGPWGSEAKDVNDRGQLAGNLVNDFGSVSSKAYLWSRGRTIELGALGGGTSSAVALNERGHVVGSATTASGHRHAFLWRDGEMIDVGTLGGDESWAVAVNDHDQVVGYSDTGRAGFLGPERHAFLWQGDLAQACCPDAVDRSAATAG